MPITLDGVEFGRGDTVWVLRGETPTEKRPVRATVEVLFPSSKLPVSGCKGGLKFEGEEIVVDYRLDVFSTKEAAEAALAKEIVVLKLDKDDVHFIWYHLVQGLKKVQQELDLLQIANERELTAVEKAMLPFQLMKLTREEMQEQINPWITYRDHFEHLMDLLKPKAVREHVFGERIRECPCDGELG